MSRNILISTVILSVVLAISAILFLLQRNIARQQLALVELAHATAVAEIQSTMATKIQAQATAQAEVEMARATAVKEVEVQATRQAETNAHVQEIEARYQAALAQKLGAQAQLRLNDTLDPTLGTLLAAESLRRFQSIEGDVAIRRGIELMSWRQVLTVDTRGGCVISISLSADGQQLATLSRSCRYESDNVAVAVWDVKTNTEIVRLTPNHDEPPVRGIDLSNDGRWLVIYQSGSYDAPHTIKVVAVDTSQQITQTVSSGSAFSPDSRRLALIRNDDTVSILDISTQKELTNLAHDQKVMGVDFSPDGRWIATYGEDTIWLWDTRNDKLTHEIAFKDSWPRFSPDGRLLAIIDRGDSVVHILEVDTWQEIAQVAYGLSIYKVEFSPDGRWLATLSGKGDVQVWETSTSTEVNRISLGPNSISTMTFSPDGQWLATNAVRGKIQLWETGTWRESARISQGGFILKFSADSKWLASNGDSFSAAKVWKLEPGPEIARFFGARKYSRLAFSSDGQWLAARPNGREGKNIQVWDITTNEALDQSELNETQMASFVFNSGNQLKIAQIDAGTIVISDTTTAQEVSHMVCGEDTAADILDFNQRLISADQTLALSADSKLLAIGGVLKENNSYKNMVRVWNVSTCQERNQLPHTYTIAQVAFSPNSQLLAVGTSQIQWDWSGVGEIRIWDVATGHELVFINSGQVWSLFFSPDSRWLVVNGSRILETKTGREVARVSDMPSHQAAFSPDNRWLATGSLVSLQDEYISVWAWQPADLIAQACARVSRNLAKEEWQQYLGNEPYRATCPDLPAPHD